MSPALRLACSLVLSLLLWLPTLPSAMNAGDAPEMIALRYLLALVVSRIGVGLVFRIVNGYAAAAAEADVEQDTDGDEPEQAAPVYGRRADDWVDPDAERTEEQLLDDALDEAHEATLVP